MRAGWWPVLIIGAFLLAIVFGGLLHWLLQRGWYLVILVPSAAGLVLGVLISVFVALAHCRRPVTAGAVGAMAGLAMYLGSFYFGMLGQLPPGNAWRLDLLPGYIAVRLRTDVGRAIGRPNPGRQPSFSANCVAFSIELALTMCMAAAAPALRARRSYVPELGQWMAREERRLPAGLLPEFSRAFEAAGLREFAQWVLRDPKALAQAQIARHYGSCVLEYVRHPRRSPLEFPVYLTFVDDAANWIDAAFRRRGIRQLQIEPAEVAALRGLFSNLDRILAGFQVGNDGRASSREQVEASREPMSPAIGREATIRDVPDGGTLRSGRFLLAINLLGLIPLVTFFGGIVLIAMGAWGWSHGWGAAAGLAWMLVGALSFVAGAVQAKQYSGLLEGWYARRGLKAILALRGDAIVPAGDSDAETVNMTRRENWIKVQVDVRDDIGLLAIDEKRRELRIEGDKRRYRIPSDSIVACEPECMHHPLDKRLQNQYWYVRLLVRAEGAERELMFAPIFKDWRPRTNENRRLVAEQLCRRILRLGAH